MEVVKNWFVLGDHLRTQRSSKNSIPIAEEFRLISNKQ